MDDQERPWKCSRLKKDKETRDLNATHDPRLDCIRRENAVKTLLEQLTKTGYGQIEVCSNVKFIEDDNHPLVT